MIPLPSHLVLVASLFVFAPFAHGIEEPPADLARGAIDPYDPGGQRGSFFAIAGVDNELSEPEFKADGEGKRRFVQPFDVWASLVKFDANSNGTLDWLEANAYREELRARVLAKFDADRNRRLNGPERDEANKALAKGQLPPPIPGAAPAPVPAKPSPASAAPAGAADDPNRTPQQKFVDRFTFMTDPDIDFAKVDMQAEMVKAFDANGNGQLEPEENAEFGRLYQQRLLDHYDTNRDGQIDALEEIVQMDSMMERGAARAVKQMERYSKEQNLSPQQREMFAKSLDSMRGQFDIVKRQRLKKYDADLDGALSLPEAQAWKESRNARGKRMQEAVARRFDKNGSGQMDTKEEFEAFNEFQRAAMQKQFQNARSPAMLDRFDEDQDGQVLGEEQEEMMTQLMIEAMEAKE